jgi:predicted SprT family Zn-dependent metalloprotease
VTARRTQATGGGSPGGKEIRNKKVCHEIGEGGKGSNNRQTDKNEQSRSKKNEQEYRCQVCTKQSERTLRQPDGEEKVDGVRCERKADSSDRISLCRDCAKKSN